MRYVVAGVHPWNRQVFDERISTLSGEWTYIDEKSELTADHLEQIDPGFVFFLHWSWIIPSAIVEKWECVNFHMTDLPYGRGGSPLQNLISRGHKSTKLTAHKMTGEVDAGPVYLKRDLSLDGAAREIYVRASNLAAEMIAELVANPVTPAPQDGEVTYFERRTPDESRMPASASLEELYDFIRMLDADDYPKAFVTHNGIRYEFSDANMSKTGLEARVQITPEDRS